MKSPVDPTRIRQQTDDTLRAERDITDDLMFESEHAERFVDHLVRERLTSAEQQLRYARTHADARLDQHATILPEVSDKLEQVANSLSEAATTLTGAAGMLKDASPVDVVANLAAVAEQVKETAGDISDAGPGLAEGTDVSGRMVEQLAAIAEGIA